MFWKTFHLGRGQSVEAWGKNYCCIDLILDLTLSWSFEKKRPTFTSWHAICTCPSSLATCFFVESWVPVPSNATANILHHIWDASPVKVAPRLCFSSWQSAKFSFFSCSTIWQKVNDVNTRDGTCTKELIGSYQLKIFYETKMVIIHASCLHEKKSWSKYHAIYIYLLVCSWVPNLVTLCHFHGWPWEVSVVHTNRDDAKLLEPKQSVSQAS